MKNLKALGNNVILRTDLQTHEYTTNEGIIYKENQLDGSLIVWSEVHSVGPDVNIDIKEGDWVCWKLNSAVGHFKMEDEPYDMVPDSGILLVKDAT